MFYYIKGVLSALNPDFAVLDADGVGYMLYVSLATHEKLAPLYGKQAQLYTYLNVREDAMELFGFYTEEERECFIKLLSVSGVGPRAAMAILSLYTPQSLASLVASGDAKAISRANGVGLKTAQKVIIELKGKLDLTEGAAAGPLPSALADAADTLAVMGYSKAESAEALRGINADQPLENIIKDALKKLNRLG